jgi:hypothetical protein
MIKLQIFGENGTKQGRSTLRIRGDVYIRINSRLLLIQQQNP